MLDYRFRDIVDLYLKCYSVCRVESRKVWFRYTVGFFLKIFTNLKCTGYNRAKKSEVLLGVDIS